MKNNLALEALNDCLSLMGDLGCDVPAYPQSYMIDYNPSLALQNTRWIYNKMTFRGADRAVTQKFLDNVHLNLGWILMVLQKYYGPLPPAPLPNIPRDDPDEIRASLAAEFRERFQSVAEAV